MSGLKPQVYREERSAEHFRHVHERIRAAEPNPVVYNAVRALVAPPTLLYMRTKEIGVENVPQDGPVVLAPNHFSHWDHFVGGIHLHRKVQFMAKSQLFGNRLLTWVFKTGGTFPVRRGRGDADALETARAILRRGGLLLMYPEGGRSRTGRLADKVRHGLGQLALEMGAPVVPVAIHGTEQLQGWREGLRRLRLPKVTVQYGEPLRFDRIAEPTRVQAQAASDRVFDSVRRMHDALSAALEAYPRREVLRRAREGTLPEALPGVVRPALPAGDG